MVTFVLAFGTTPSWVWQTFLTRVVTTQLGGEGAGGGLPNINVAVKNKAHAHTFILISSLLPRCLIFSNPFFIVLGGLIYRRRPSLTRSFLAGLFIFHLLPCWFLLTYSPFCCDSPPPPLAAHLLSSAHFLPLAVSSRIAADSCSQLCVLLMSR